MRTTNKDPAWLPYLRVHWNARELWWPRHLRGCRRATAVGHAARALLRSTREAEGLY